MAVTETRIGKCGVTGRWQAAGFAALFVVATGASAPAADCVASVAELRAVLDLPAEQKSGRVVCIAPGDYRALGREDFAGRFVGLEAGRPIVFEARDPARRPVFSHWFMGGGGAPSGNVVLRGLEFRIGGPEVPAGTRGFKGSEIAIHYGHDHPVENFTVEDVVIRGTLREARKGGRETARYQMGINGRMSRNLVIRNNRFENIVHAITVAGEGIVVEGNVMRRGWGDLVQVVPQVKPGGSCDPTTGVIVRNNVLGNVWGNGRIHPDLVHLFPASRVGCGIRDVLIEGNIVYPGRDGVRQPAFPSWFEPVPPRPVPETIAEAGPVFHRFTGGGTVRLPPAACAARREMVAIQRDPGRAPPLVVQAAPGDVLRIKREEASAVSLADDWETWRFMCRPNQPGGWLAQRLQPYLQGVFSNGLIGDTGYENVVVRYNVLWVNSPHGISFRDRDDRDIEVYRNSVLVPYPGDLDGDGRANEDNDGLNTFFGSAAILLHADPSIRAYRNIAASVGWTGMAEAQAGNDTGIDARDGGRGMALRFSQSAPGPAFMPDTPREAVLLARPKPSGPLGHGGIGALGASREEDRYDFGWVDDDW